MLSFRSHTPKMKTLRLFGLTFLVAWLSCGCGDSGPSSVVLTPRAVPNSPRVQPAPVNGINGEYRGDLTFTEEDTSYGWPAHLTVVAYLDQNGNAVTGKFKLLEVDYSGGFVKGTVDLGAGGDPFGAFRADFLPDDLGDHFAIETKIISPDSSRFEGTFVFAEGVVGQGIATFTRAN